MTIYTFRKQVSDNFSLPLKLYFTGYAIDEVVNAGVMYHQNIAVSLWIFLSLEVILQIIQDRADRLINPPQVKIIICYNLNLIFFITHLFLFYD